MDKYLPKALFEEGNVSFFTPDKYIIILLCMGVVILITALLPRILSNSKVTSPMIYVVVGILLFLIPVKVILPTLLNNPDWMKRFTEMGVIVALTGAGLKLNNPFSYRTWRISIRLLIITMPATIAAIAFSGWWILGMVPASAVLLGAVLAPTDPVLAADVQTTPPDEEDHSETKLALTTEAGMNDGLAFPFTNMAIAMVLVGNAPSDWIWSWLTMDFFYKIIVGFIGGYISGRVLGFIAFRTKVKTHLAKITTGILAMSLTLIPYGLTELAHGYGFIAVFVAACVFRKQESSHEYQVSLHNFSEDIERVLLAILLVILGGYIALGIFNDVSFAMIMVTLLILLFIRPVLGWLSLAGLGLPNKNRLVISFFGIRGVGSLYYFTYALSAAEFSDAELMLDVILMVILGSILIHGFAASPAIKWMDKQVE